MIGGLLIGWGMAIAQSCASGLLYKFGAGMAGAAVEILGWIGGELAVRKVRLPGPTVLPGGNGGTIPGLLGLPRLVAAVVVLAVVGGALRRWRGHDGAPRARWQWKWPMLGLALGAVLVLGWMFAALGGVDFGRAQSARVGGDRCGQSELMADRLSARHRRRWRDRGAQYGRLPVARREQGPVRQAAGRRLLLGAGGWIARGCNLGHGLSGMAQLNVSSLVVVACMALGVGHARAMTRPEQRRKTPTG